MRKVEAIKSLLIRKGEPAGHADFDPEDADAPDGGTLVNLAGEGEDENVVNRVSWTARRKALVLGGVVVTDAKRKPRRQGTVAVPFSRMPLIADIAGLTDAETALWLSLFPADGSSGPLLTDAQTASVSAISRKVIDAMIGKTFVIDDGGKTVSILA